MKVFTKNVWFVSGNRGVEPLQVSKMESFATTVNGLRSLTVVAKLFILYICGFLTTPPEEQPGKRK